MRTSDCVFYCIAAVMWEIIMIIPLLFLTLLRAGTVCRSVSLFCRVTIVANYNPKVNAARLKHMPRGQYQQRAAYGTT